MKKQNRHSHKGLRRGRRRSRFSNTHSTGFPLRGEQLEERALMAVDVEYRLVATPAGTALPSDTPTLVNDDPTTRFAPFATPNVSVGGTLAPNAFTLSVYAQDVRTSPPPAHTTSENDQHGFVQAFLDVAFNQNLVNLPTGTQASSFTPGNRFTPDDGLFTPPGRPIGVVQGSVATAGLLNDVGVYVDFNDQFSAANGQNSREMLMFRAPFQVKGAAINGQNDDLRGSVSINEEAQNVAISVASVLGNDTVGGLVSLTGAPATFVAETKAQFIVPAGGTVDDPSGFHFTNATVNVLGTKGISLPSFSTSQGGTVQISGGNILYTPKADFFGDDTFTYRLFNSDDPNSASQTLTVTVRVNAANDAPKMDAISPAVVNLQEDATVIPAVNITGVSAGNTAEAAQQLQVTATSNNQTLIRNQDIAVVYPAGSPADPTKATITYGLVPDAFGTADILVTVTDGGNDNLLSTPGDNATFTRTFTVNVAPVNDAPKLTVDPTVLQFNENGGAKVVDALLGLTDDSPNLTGATITIEGYVAGQDVLAATGGSGITVQAFNTTTGVLALSGSASPAAYQTVLRSVTYNNTSENPTGGQRVLRFRATDNGTPALTGTGARTVNVNAINDAPLITTTAGTTAYAENAAAVVIDANVTVSDADNTNLVSAQVRIATGFVAGDQLVFANQNGITGNYDAGTGILTLTGSSSVANYQTAFQSVKFQHNGESPTSVSRVVQFVANDGIANSLAKTKTVAVTAANDAPVLTTSAGNLAYTEGDGEKTIDAAITLTDADNTTISTATVEFTAGFVNGQDTLALPAQASGITGTFSVVANVGKLTLNLSAPGANTIANVLAALRSVTYRNSSGNPSGALRTVKFSVSDGAATATANKSISVSSISTPPTVNTSPGSLAYTEGNPATAIDAGLTITDIDSTSFTGATVEITGNFAAGQDELSFTAVTGITGVVSADKSRITFSGNTTLANYQNALRGVKYRNASSDPSLLQRTVTFTLNDGAVSGSNTRTINVSPFSNPPVVNAQTGSTAYVENAAAVAVAPNLTVVDQDNTTLAGATAQITSGFNAAQDVLSFTDQLGITGSYDPATGKLTLTGSASLADYQAALRSIGYSNTSNNPATANRIVTFIADDGIAKSAASTKTVTVVAVNDEPTLNALGNVTVLEESLTTAVNLSGISAGGGETQTITVTATSSNTALIPNPTVTYTSANPTGTLSFKPTANKSGEAIITVTVKDNGGVANGGDDTRVQTFTITVTAINDQPQLNPITNTTVVEDTTAVQTVSLSGILASLAAAGETNNLTVTAVSSDPGLIDPQVNYTPNSSTGTITYVPGPNRFGTAVITVTVQDDGGTDNGGVDTIIRTFSVRVLAVNDAPTAGPDEYNILETESLTIPWETLLGGVQPLFNNDSEGPSEAAQTLKVKSITSIPADQGTLTLNATNKTIVYTPPAPVGGVPFIGTVNFQYTVEDNGQTERLVNGVVQTSNDFKTSAPANITINVDPPQLPFARRDNFTVLEDSGVNPLDVLANDRGTGLFISSVATDPVNGPQHGTVAIVNGKIDYRPNDHYFGPDSFQYTIDDNDPSTPDTSTAVVSITVTPVNDEPTLDAIADLGGVREDDPEQLVSLAGITSGQPNEIQTLSATAVVESTTNPLLITNLSVGSVNASGEATLKFTPGGNQFGQAVIKVTVTDNGGTADGGVNTTIERFTVTVGSVNDEPTISTANSLVVNVNEDAALQTINLTNITPGGGTPEAAQTLDVTVSTDRPELFETLTVDNTKPTSQLKFKPALNANGQALVTVKVKDNGGTDLGGDDEKLLTFTVNITPVNDAPTLGVLANVSINEDADLQSVDLASILAGIAGTNENQNLTITATSSNTALIPNPAVIYTSPSDTGSITFKPAANLPIATPAATAIISVKVTDDGGTANGGVNSITRTFTVTVNPVNDAPTLNALGNLVVNEGAAAQKVNLSGISAGGGESQPLRVTATSGNTALIPNPSVTYSTLSPTVGSVSFTPAADKPSGNTAETAVITVKVEDGGLDKNINTPADNAFTTQTFTVTVNPVNDVPTINTIASVTVNEDAGDKTVALSGISAGGGETQQNLRFEVTSSNPTLIPVPTIDHTPGAQAATLNYRAADNGSGKSTITVKVRDDGLDGIEGNADDGTSLVRTFTITVNSVNDQPTIDIIDSPTVLEDSGLHQIPLSGITAGPGESTQTLTVTATSSNTAIVPNPTITTVNGVRTLNFTPAANRFGQVIITVKVADNGGTTNGGVNTKLQQFSITVTPKNDAPTLKVGTALAAVSNVTINENTAALTTVSLSGISAGPFEESQSFSITATSNNPDLIPNDPANLVAALVATTTGPNQFTTGTVKFKPAADQNGQAIITVRIDDNGGTAFGGVDFIEKTFTVTVRPVNSAPSFGAFDDPPPVENTAGQQTLDIPVSAGLNEAQKVRVTASTVSGIITINTPTIEVTTDATGSAIVQLRYTPVAGQTGTAVINLAIRDAGTDAIVGNASNDLAGPGRSFNVQVVAEGEGEAAAIALTPPAALVSAAPKPKTSLRDFFALTPRLATYRQTEAANFAAAVDELFTSGFEF